MSTPDFTERQVARKPGRETDKPAADTKRDAGSNERERTGPVEVGGPKGPDPTRYGDWELNGRCIDF